MLFGNVHIDKPVPGKKAAGHWCWSEDDVAQKSGVPGLGFSPLAIGAGYFVHRRTVRFGPKIARSAALVVEGGGTLGRPRRSVQSGGCVVVDARQLLRKLDDAECAAISGLAFLAVFALGGHES